MKYCTETIPLPLAKKLKEKGMPMDNIENFAGTGKDIALAPSYGKVFDWLMSEKGLVLHIWAGGDEHTKSNMVDLGWGVKNAVGEGNFHEAANAAIEKALTLI